MVTVHRAQHGAVWGGGAAAACGACGAERAGVRPGLGAALQQPGPRAAQAEALRRGATVTKQLVTH